MAEAPEPHEVVGKVEAVVAIEGEDITLHEILYAHAPLYVQIACRRIRLHPSERIPASGKLHRMKNRGFAPLGARRVLSAAGGVIVLVLLVTMGATGAAAAAPRASRTTRTTGPDGATLYAQHCARCHGSS